MEMPDMMLWVAKVIRNAGTLNFVMMIPCTTSQARRTKGRPDSYQDACDRIIKKTIRTMMIPVRASMEPTERSIPPTRIAKMEPDTMMPITDTDHTLDRLAMVGKLWAQ